MSADRRKNRNLPRELRGRKCGAKCKPREGDAPGTVRYCSQAAGWKTTHPGYGNCKFHGGSTAAGIMFAERQRAELAVVTFGLPIDVTPQDALLQEVHRCAGTVAYLQDVVRTLGQDQLKQRTFDNKGLSWEKPAVWVDMYQAERAALVRVSAEAIKCGVAERAVALAEAQGQMLATVIKAILLELGVANDPRAPEIVGRNLRAVSALASGG